MTKIEIVAALHAGGALVKYNDRSWFVRDRHGETLSGNYLNRQTVLKLIREWPGGLHYRKSEDGLYEEWRRKAGLAYPIAPGPPAAPKAGVCRICGCSEQDACFIQASLAGGPRPCGWADGTRTLCDHPACMAKAAKGG